MIAQEAAQYALSATTTVSTVVIIAIREWDKDRYRGILRTTLAPALSPSRRQKDITISSYHYYAFSLLDLPRGPITDIVNDGRNEDTIVLCVLEERCVRLAKIYIFILKKF